MGMELFGNLIKMEGSYPSPGEKTSDGENLTATMFCGNIKLKGSDFYADRYCNNNFNNILRAFKVLFDLMVVNQWHSILEVILCNFKVILWKFDFFNVKTSCLKGEKRMPESHSFSARRQQT